MRRYHWLGGLSRFVLLESQLNFKNITEGLRVREDIEWSGMPHLLLWC